MRYAFNDRKLALHFNGIDEAIEKLRKLKENKLGRIDIRKIENVVVSVIIEGDYEFKGDKQC